jgi:hypothetical protein
MHPALSQELMDDAYEDDAETAAAGVGRVVPRSDLESYVSTAVIEACTEDYGVGMSQVPRHPPEPSWHLYVHAS